MQKQLHKFKQYNDGNEFNVDNFTNILKNLLNISMEPFFTKIDILF